MKRPLSHVAHRFGCSNVMELLFSDQFVEQIKDTPIFYNGEQIWISRHSDNTFNFMAYVGGIYTKLTLTYERANQLWIPEKQFCDIVGDEYVINISNCKSMYDGHPQSEPRVSPEPSRSSGTLLTSMAVISGLVGVVVGLERTGCWKSMFGNRKTVK